MPYDCMGGGRGKPSHPLEATTRPALPVLGTNRYFGRHTYNILTYYTTHFTLHREGVPAAGGEPMQGTAATRLAGPARHAACRYAQAE